MEKSWAFVRLGEVSVGVDRSDVTVAFCLNLWPQAGRERNKSREGEHYSETHYFHFIRLNHEV